MSTTVSYAEFEHLQDRVDTLENVLCDLTDTSNGEYTITKHALKRALKDAKVLEE